MRCDLRVRVEKCLRVRGCYDGRSIKHDMLGTELWLDAGRGGLGLIFFFFWQTGKQTQGVWHNFWADVWESEEASILPGGEI